MSVPLAMCACMAMASAAVADHISPEVWADGDECQQGDCLLSLRQLRGERGSMQAELSVAAAEDVAISANASAGPLLTFHMYRAVSDEVYPPLNVNTGNLAGVLWYLHHEVVITNPRKFGITKIIRFKVQMRATEPLSELGMNFGVRHAFDAGQDTGPFACGKDSSGPKFCAGAFKDSYIGDLPHYEGKDLPHYSGPFEWEKYGYFVGCNKLGEFPFPMEPVSYPDAVWYSLPGPCPSKTFAEMDDACKAADPGGFCPGVVPTGARDCTWNYEAAGEEVTLGELEAMGNGLFWGNINSAEDSAARVRMAKAAFEKKYSPELPAPPCDFTYNKFFRPFFRKDPSEGPCNDAKPGDECYQAVMAAMQDYFPKHPEWFDGLTANSNFRDFQEVLFQQDKGSCLRPCS